MSSCFIADDSHVKIVLLHVIVFIEHYFLPFWHNVHLLKYFPVKVPQNCFNYFNCLNGGRTQIFSQNLENFPKKAFLSKLTLRVLTCNIWNLVTFGHYNFAKLMFFYSLSNMNSWATKGYFSVEGLLVKYQAFLSSFEKPSAQEIAFSSFPVVPSELRQ